MKDVGSSICSQKLAGRLVRIMLCSRFPSQWQLFLWAGFGLGGEFWELLLLQEACKEYKMALEKAVFFKISVKGGDGLDRSSLAE